MTYHINNNFSIVCYYWDSGAYISGYHSDFEEELAAFIKQYGTPCRIASSIINDAFETIDF